MCGDSKEGWTEALAIYLDVLSKPEYEHVHTIKISYNSIRPKGERLNTFGGHASGHESLKGMFEGFTKVLRNEIDPTLAPLEVVNAEKGYVKVRPIHLLDMGNLIGNNVVVGKKTLCPR
jgi:ribonucleoside-diphosphate reductase alpha chain/ribonucleoside-triphosphate reductase